MCRKIIRAFSILTRLSFDTHLWCASVIGGALLLCFSFFTGSVDRQVLGLGGSVQEVNEGERIIEYSSIFGNINLDAISDASELYSYIPEEVDTEVEGFESVEEAIVASGVLELEDDDSIKIVDSFARVGRADDSEGLDEPNDSSVNIIDHTEDYVGMTEYTSEEVELLGKLVQCEAESEDLQGKVLIANVVLNRVENGEWGNSITDVILSPGQFMPVKNGAYKMTEADRLTKEAVLIALSGQNNSQGALYFQKSNQPWTGREFLFTYGAHSFYK